MNRYHHKTIKDRLIDFAYSHRVFSSVDLEKFKDEIKAREGILKGLMRIHRTARDLAMQGIFRRLSKEEKILRGLDKRFAYYEWKERQQEFAGMQNNG